MQPGSIITIGIMKSVGITIEYSWDWNKVLVIAALGFFIEIMFKEPDSGGWFSISNEYK